MSKQVIGMYYEQMNKQVIGMYYEQTSYRDVL